jgi:NAD(P)-dependent dehydrogenase (short-subunit alcohol dehydrogenase family)
MILEELSLKGKTALVSGASSGLGKGIALALAEAGADVVAAARNAERLEEVAKEIRGLGRQAWAVQLDVSRSSAFSAQVATIIEQCGQIDILVNAAGMNIRKPILEVTEADWDYLMSVQLKGVFFLSQAVAPYMIKQGRGKIINIASLSSVIGLANISIYCAAKGGIAQLTKAMAVEWAKHGINVNAIGPGYYETPMTRPVFEDPERVNWMLSRIPFGRTGVPKDLAGAAVYLASDASNYVTGQILYVDGGWLAS